MISKEELKNLLEQYLNHKELLPVLAHEMPYMMKAEEMVELLILFDELDHEMSGVPDSDFVEALAYETDAEPDEVDRFWKYLAMGNYDAEWED